MAAYTCMLSVCGSGATHTHTHTRTYTHTHAYIYTHIYNTRTHATHTHTHKQHTCTLTHIYTYTHTTNAHMHTCTYTHTRNAHTHTHMNTHTYTHTHTHNPADQSKRRRDVVRQKTAEYLQHTEELYQKYLLRKGEVQEREAGEEPPQARVPPQTSSCTCSSALLFFVGQSMYSCGCW